MRRERFTHRGQVSTSLLVGIALGSLFVHASIAFGQSNQTSAPPTAAQAKPSFEDVLAHPDDAELNLAYARELVEEGRLDLAASTLQRILLTNPGLDHVRLFYAVVLFRLGNLTQAESELRSLQGKDLSSQMAAEVDGYLARIEKDTDPVQGYIQFSYGVNFDSNRNSFPTSGVHEISFPPGTPPFEVDFVQANGQTANREADVGFFGLATVGGSYDTGHQRARELFGQVTFGVDRQINQTEFDNESVQAGGGLVYEADFATLIPTANYEYLRLDDQTLVNDGYGRLRLERRLSTANMLAIGEVTVGYRDYNQTPTAPIASDRDGTYFDGEIGALFPVNLKTQLLTTYRFEYKNANKSYETYTSNRIRARLVYLLPENDFVYIDASVNRVQYDEPDPFIAPNSTRRDWDTRVQATYGIPVKDLLGKSNLDPTIGNSIFSLSAEYYRQDSNRTGYSFDNIRFSMYLTTTWDL